MWTNRKRRKPSEWDQSFFDISVLLARVFVITLFSLILDMKPIKLHRT